MFRDLKVAVWEVLSVIRDAQTCVLKGPGIEGATALCGLGGAGFAEEGEVEKAMGRDGVQEEGFRVTV